MLEEDEVQRVFGDALNALPLPPAFFNLYFKFNSDELTDESRALVDEREEFESAETPVDEAEVDDRRRAVHERGRAAADQMRRDSAQ